jgi:hypothetical protein
MILSLTTTHWQVALVSGALAGVFGVAVSFTRSPQPSDPLRIALD